MNSETEEKKTDRIVEIKVRPEKIRDREHVRGLVQKAAGTEHVEHFTVLRRSVDARGKHPFYLLRVSVGEQAPPVETPLKNLLKPLGKGAAEAVVAGAGPAGYFAALTLIERGVRPVVLERGKDVDSRRGDIALLHRKSVVNPDSNYCFGEGGAGTFSDGKLYTRATKRGDVTKVLRYFVEHGADPDILVDAHPHIGSNRLPQIVRRIRQTILECGGRIHFDSKVVDLAIRNGKCLGAITEKGGEFLADGVVLATGHSSREIYEMLYRRNIALVSKPFAVGVRVEHPQELIDRIQYGKKKRPKGLGPAIYRLTAQVDGRGVFTFCMCPGGYVIPASTSPGELVLNGMSMSSRSGRFANAGVVVEIRPEDLGDRASGDPFCLLRFQADLERKVFEASGGKTQAAPAQRMADFVGDRESADIPESSYIPGVFSHPLREILPDFVSVPLKKAFEMFDRKMRGYFTGEALLLAAESRTSAPVKIPRDPVTLTHPEIEGLYPCGEGAGHAGGIVSAALDGIRVAERIGRG